MTRKAIRDNIKHLNNKRQRFIESKAPKNVITKVMDYSKAKIYQIINDVSDDIYIGSTCQPLSKRVAEHRTSMRSKRDSHIKLYQKMEEIGVEHF